MNREHPSGDIGTSPTELIELNRICDRFEELWRAGGRPAIEDQLAMAQEPARSELLRDLLQAELEFRHAAGECPRLAEYRARFPGQITLVESAFGAAGISDLAPGAGPEPAASGETIASAPDSAARGPSVSGGRFRVLRPHARGGLGQVYVALDRELGRRVALKEIRVEKASNPSLRSRFLLEAEINGNLEHPGIVPVYSLGTHDDGRPFYAMRFIQGESLKEAIEAFHSAVPTLEPSAANLRLRQLLGRFVDVCDAIAYAHSRGVLHRDLKPANIMLGAYGETLIIDWGLAKAVGRRDPASGGAESTLVPSSADSHEPTVAGHVLGSPRYMSPEQAHGILDGVGPATDVYGLGATLYALLTGKAPVAGATAEEVLPKVRTGAIAPPRDLNHRVPRALEAICLKALALDPRDRYRSARALSGDIEHWLADEPVSALREPVRDRARRWARRHRTLVTTAAAVVLLGVIGLFAFAAVVGDKNRKLVAANLATRQAESLADLRLDRAVASIEDYFTGVGEDALKGGHLSPTLREGLLAKPRQFYEQLADEIAAKPNPTIRERALLAKGERNLARILLILGRNAEARTQGEAAVDHYLTLAQHHPEVLEYQDGLASSHTNLGGVLAAIGQFDLASGAYDQAITIYQALDQRHPDVPKYRTGLADSHTSKGKVLQKTGRSQLAAAEYEQAIAIYQSLAQRQPQDPDYQNGLVTSHSNLGTFFGGLGQREKAAAEFEKAVEIGERLVAREPDVAAYQNALARSHSNLGVLRYETGRPDLAAGEYQKAIAIREKLVARQPDVPEFQNGLATSHGNLGAALADTGRTDAAAAAHKKAITIREALVAGHPDVPEYQNGLATSHGNLANVLAAMRRLDSAAAEYELAITIGEALVSRQPGVPEYQNGVANSHKNQGILLRDRGKLAEALAAFERARKIAPPGSSVAAALPEHIHKTEALLSLANRLPAILDGSDKPGNSAEGLALAQLCYARSRFAAAAKLCEKTLAADPGLAEDRRAQPRYNAACFAALAGAGKGTDLPALEADAKARLRAQARDWLKAELAAWTKVIEAGRAQDSVAAAAILERWHEDSDLAGVRDRESLEKLPETERTQWRKLWSDVGALRAKAREKQP